MADETNSGPTPSYKPYVPPESTMTEFSLRAIVIGLVLAVVLGAANAYLGLKAGMTIAATYPAAVISMALLRLMRGSILEENMARTVGSIGESVAAGAIFTLPAFIISGVWKELDYFQSTAIMLVGGVMGVLFVALLRRAMVEDKDLPYPESVAASEIHKAGRTGGTGALFLALAGVVGAIVECAKRVHLFAETWSQWVPFAKSSVNLSGGAAAAGTAVKVEGSGGMLLSSPGVSPAFVGVGYVIGPKLASLNFSGGVLAWGLFVPILLYFLGPHLGTPPEGAEAAASFWTAKAVGVWKYIVRPIAIGGMLVSAAFTLWRMRKNLVGGIRRSVADLKKSATGGVADNRVERDLHIQWVLLGIGVSAICTFFLYWYFSENVTAALVATGVMIVAGFFFAAVSGYLVGMIGSSNNPISGLTLSTVIVAAILMVYLGQSGLPGVAAVLGVAGVICVSAAVAGEMLQDLKVGHILGGTPWKMQAGNLLGVALASCVMYFPLVALHEGEMKASGIGFGGPKLPAPQASLMALVSTGIVEGEMAWPLIIAGMLMAVAFILIGVRSPMLVCVGMYLGLETTFAIFLGGLFRGGVDMLSARRAHNAAQKARVENTGVLLASGLIAGEALTGLVFAGLAYFDVNIVKLFADPSFGPSIAVFVALGLLLIFVPFLKAGRPEDPAPPSAIM